MQLVFALLLLAAFGFFLFTRVRAARRDEAANPPVAGTPGPKPRPNPLRPSVDDR